MFAVIFEVHPRPEKWDAYLAQAKILRPGNYPRRSLGRSGVQRAEYGVKRLGSGEASGIDG